MRIRICIYMLEANFVIFIPLIFYSIFVHACMHVMQVTLGVMMKNENKREDVVDIAENVITKYVPSVTDNEVKTYIDIPFVGDQLTVERLRNVQRIRTADNEFDRLQHIEPVIAIGMQNKVSMGYIC